MALSRTDVISGASGSNHGTGTYVTGSFTPPANSLLVVCIAAENVATSATNASITVAGGSLTYTQQQGNEGLNDGTDAISIWTAPVGSSPASMTLTIDCGAESMFRYLVDVFAYTLYEVASPVGAKGGTSSANGGAPTSFSLDANPLSSSEVIAFGMTDGGIQADPVAGTGWSQRFLQNPDVKTLSETRTGSTSATVLFNTLTSSGGSGMAVSAIEIKAQTVTFDATSSSSSVAQPPDLTWAHTVSGTQNYLEVHVGLTSGALGNVTGITYNGVPMTLLWSLTPGAGLRSSAYGLAGPATGTHNIVASVSGANDGFTGVGVSYNGVSQSTPTGTAVTASGNTGTAASVNVSTSAGDMVSGGFSIGNNATAITIGAGETERGASNLIVSNNEHDNRVAEKIGVGTTTMSYSWTTSTDWAMGAVAIHPFTAPIDMTATGLTVGSPVFGAPIFNLGLKLEDRVLDFGLDVLDAQATHIYVCTNKPTTYSEATSTYALGNKSFGAGAVFGSPAAGSPTGRKVTSVAVTGGSVTATGTIYQWAVVDSVNSRLLATGPVSSVLGVTNGAAFDLEAFAIHTWK